MSYRYKAKEKIIGQAVTELAAQGEGPQSGTVPMIMNFSMV